jgi:hypothetical protein
MANDSDKFWLELVARVGLKPLSQEQAESELANAPEEPVSENEVESFVRAAVRGEWTVWRPSFSEEWVAGADVSTVEEEVLQLNRNPGESDAETERLLEECRRKALENGEPDDEKGPDGVDGRPAAPGDGC